MELDSLVRTMNARNRQRFQENPQLLASWISASTVLGAKRGVAVAAEAPAAGRSRAVQWLMPGRVGRRSLRVM